MDLYRLSQPSYLFEEIIEGYSSLIWTERYQQFGEIELETPNISSTMTKLPLGCLVSINESNEVMLIDSHQITKQKDGSRTLKVSGRSLVGFLDERAAIKDDLPLNNATTGKAETWEYGGTASAILSAVLKYHIVDGTVDIKDIIPNVTVTGFAPVDVSSYRIIPRKSLYEVARDFMSEQNFGMCTYRPLSTGGVTQLKFIIYQGVDRTATVILYEKNGDFVTTNYVKTIRGSKSYVYGSAPRVNSNLARTGTSTWTGFNRRVALNDCPDISSSSTTNEGQMLAARNRKVLADNPTITAFDCEVNPIVAKSMTLSSHLGNVIKCITDFGATTSMRIVEYTRVDDQNGSKEYPTLVMI